MSDETHNDVVEISVPDSNAFVATLRLTAASLAARCDLTVDDIEDLRLAVDEACALLLPQSRGGRLTARFQLQPQRLWVEVGVNAADGSAPDRTGFAWTVLEALSSNVEVTSADGRLSISLERRRGVDAGE